MLKKGGGKCLKNKMINLASYFIKKIHKSEYVCTVQCRFVHRIRSAAGFGAEFGNGVPDNEIVFSCEDKTVFMGVAFVHDFAHLLSVCSVGRWRLCKKLHE